MTLNRREAEKGSGDWSPGGVWGGNPIVTPTDPQARSAINYESGSEASPDSTPVCLNRREAETGFGDEIPKRGMGWQPQPNPKREAQPKMNQGAKRYLIPLTPHPLAPTSPIFQTPPAKRIIR